MLTIDSSSVNGFARPRARCSIRITQNTNSIRTIFAFPVLCTRPYRSPALYIIQRDKNKKQVSRLNETVSRLVDLHMYRRYEGLLSEN